MSYATVYVIRPNGDVEHYDDAQNALAGASYIWDVYEKEFGFLDAGRHPMLTGEYKCWAKFKDPNAPLEKRIVIGFTFDDVWVRRDRIPQLVDALRLFWRDHSKRWDSFEGKWSAVVPTIATLADIIERAGKEDIRGVCFQQTSVSDNAWLLPGPTEDDEWRPFNFDRDKLTAYDGEPWELFEVLEEVAKEPSCPTT
jgi:hypothetical protein